MQALTTTGYCVPTGMMHGRSRRNTKHANGAKTRNFQKIICQTTLHHGNSINRLGCLAMKGRQQRAEKPQSLTIAEMCSMVLLSP
jgi:hypothetical protein